MRPFTEPISERSRQKYGTYQPRYEEVKGMQPFDADISSYKRELYGDYQKRYETTSSMSAFDSELGSYKRDMFGDYLPKYSTIKVATRAILKGVADGMNLVDMEWTLPWFTIIDPKFEISIYQYWAFTLGTWTGTPNWRMTLNDKKVYPFSSMDEVDITQTVQSLGSLSVKVRMGDELKVQMMSDNAADGVGDELYIYLNYVTWEP